MTYWFSSAPKVSRFQELQNNVNASGEYNKKRIEVIGEQVVQFLDRYLEFLSKNGITKHTFDMAHIPYKSYNNEVPFKPKADEIEYMRSKIERYLIESQIPYTLRDNIFFIDWKTPAPIKL